MKRKLLPILICLTAGLASPSVGFANPNPVNASGLNVSVSLPLELVPTADDFNFFTVVDANNDNKKWAYKSNFHGFVSPSNDNLDADDWLIFPAINFDASKTYELSFMLAQNMKGPLYRSAFEVYVGPDPDPADMQKFGSRIDFYSTSGRIDQPEGPFTTQFGISGESGTRYVAIRCVTPKLERIDNPDNWKGYDEISSWPASVSSITLRETSVSAQTPKTPEIEVAPAEMGELKARVTFAMPVESLDGSPLRPADPVSAHIWSEAQELVVDQLPGSQVDVWVNTLQGTNEIFVRIDSDEEGVAVSKEVYTGVYKPNRVHNLSGSVSADNLSMTLTWTPPTSAKDNGYFDPAAVTYGAYRADDASGYVLVEEIGSELSYTYTLLPTDPQAAHTVYIFPSNAAGMSDDTTSWTYEDPVRYTAVLGSPYVLPLREDFAGLEVACPPMRNEKPDGYYGRIVLQDPSGWLSCADGAAMLAYNPLSDEGTMARAATPKISTKGISNAALTLCALRMSGYTAPIHVYGLRHDSEPQLIASVNLSDIGQPEWVEHVIPLPADFQNRDWIQFYFDFELPDIDYVGIIDWYSLSHTADNDLAVTDLKSPFGFPVGVGKELKASLFNPGMSALRPEVRLDLSAAGNILHTLSIEAPQPIPSGGSLEMAFPVMADADWFGKDVVATVSIVTPDDVAENNSKSAAIQILRSEEPVVFDLRAENSGGNVLLSWSKPMTAPLITQGFESATPWSFAEDIEGFANIDVDRKSVYKFSANSMPNENTPKAFMVALPSEMQNPAGLETYGGSKYLMVTCPEQLTEGVMPEAADDWLISPLSAPGMHFSFMVDIISEQYPETFEVYASSAGRTPSDFTDLLGRFTKTRRGWEQMEFVLPDDAEYFAIRYVSRDMFGAFVDDIRFADASASMPVERYEIYRDGELLATSSSEQYVDASVAAGETHIYRVRTVAGGSHPLGNSVEIRVNDDESGVGTHSLPSYVKGVAGGLEIIGSAGLKISVVALDGVEVWSGIVPSDNFFIPTGKGIFILSPQRKTENGQRKTVMAY